MLDINWSTVIAILVIATIIEFISIVISKNIEKRLTKESKGRLDLSAAESIKPMGASMFDRKLSYLDRLMDRERLYVIDTFDNDELESIKERINELCDDIESYINAPYLLQLSKGGIVTESSFFGLNDDKETITMHKTANVGRTEIPIKE